MPTLLQKNELFSTKALTANTKRIEPLPVASHKPAEYCCIETKKSCVQKEEDSLYQQIGLKFEEETSKMLHLEHGFVWC